jgi:hypothetical protein
MSEWSEAELGKRLSPPRLYIHNVDPHCLVRLSNDPFETLIAHLQPPLPSMITNVLSLLARLAAHSSSIDVVALLLLGRKARAMPGSIQYLG